MTYHGLYNIIRIRGKPRVPDGDGIEGLKVMNEVQGPTLFLDTEPAQAVRCIRIFIDASGTLLLKEANNLIVDARQDGNILVSPRYMLNNQDFDWRKVLITKMPLLLLCLCKP